MTDTLPVFVAMALLTVATPGPTALLALHHGVHGGYRTALPGIAGAVVSDLVLIAAVAAGLGWLLRSSALAFELLRAVGVAYLVWLGLRLLRNGTTATLDPAQGGHAPQPAEAGRAFWRSLWVALSNPKGFVFFTALLPQHVVTSEPMWPQYLLLAGVFAGTDAVALLAYASAGALGLRHLDTAASRRLDRAAATVMLALATGLAFMHRPGG